MSYYLKLKDPRWQKKRLEILQRDDFRCKNCNASDKELHVHHNYYIFGVDIWDYEDDCYDTLCYECHIKATNINREIKEILKKAKFRRFAELRNILIMSEYLSMDELVRFRKDLAELLTNKGYEIEDGTSF